MTSHNAFATSFAMTATVTYRAFAHKLSAYGTMKLSYVFTFLVVAYAKVLSAIITVAVIYVLLLTASATAKLVIFRHTKRLTAHITRIFMVQGLIANISVT